METRTKQSSEQYPLTFEFYGKLPGQARCASAVVTAKLADDDSDATSAVIVDDSTVVTAYDVKFSVKGGVDGKTYLVTALVTLDDNSVLEEDLLLTINDLNQDDA